MSFQFSNTESTQKLVRVEFIEARWQESSGSLKLHRDIECGFDLHSTDNVALVLLCGVWRDIYHYQFICTEY